MKTTRRENKNKDILREFQAKKFFLFLHFRDYAFEWELKKRMNLTQKQIQIYSEELNKRGYISFRTFTELSENLQECIMETTPDFNKVWSQDPKVYIITPEGKEQAKDYLAEFLKEARTNQGVYDLVQQLQTYSKSFRLKKKEIIQKENSMTPRLIKLPNGTIFEKNTKKYYEVKALTSKGTDLIIVEDELPKLIEEEKMKEKSKTTQYEGKYSNLLPEGINPIKEVDKREETKGVNDLIDVKEQVELLNREGKRDVLVMQGAKLTKRERDNIFDEGMDFLESLESKKGDGYGDV